MRAFVVFAFLALLGCKQSGLEQTSPPDMFCDSYPNKFFVECKPECPEPDATRGDRCTDERLVCDYFEHSCICCHGAWECRDELDGNKPEPDGGCF